MKRLIALVSVLIFLLNACGGSKELAKTDTGDIPEWYLTTPTDANHVYAAASSTSRDMDLAITKASTQARANIARNLEVKINSMQKKFEEEIGQGENSEYLSQFTQATKTVVSTELSGSKIAKKKLVKDGSNWRAYVLAEYPIGEAQKAFLKQISQNDNLYTRFRSTEAFKELENDVAKYDNHEVAKMTKGAKSDIKSGDTIVPGVVATIAATALMSVDHNEFTFELTKCEMKNRKVTCSLIVKNNSENDLNLRISISETKLFDETGNEYTSDIIKLANTVSRTGSTRIEKQIIPGVPTPVVLEFDNVSSKATTVSQLSVHIIDGNHNIKFRDIPLEII